MKKLYISLGIIGLFLVLGVWGFYTLSKSPQIENSSENFTQNNQAEIYFSKKMDKASVEENLEIEPHIKTDLSWKEEKTLIIDLNENNKIDNFSVILGPEIKDRLGRSIENPQKINFVVPPKSANLTLTTPKDGATEINGKMPITFLWDSPLFPLQRADIWQEKLENQIIMMPKIEGTWSVLGTSGIIFEPKEPWRPSTEVSVTIPKEIAKKETTLSFQTTTLKIQSIKDQDLIHKKPLEIRFNQPIDLQKIAEKISIEPKIKFNLEYGKVNFAESEKIDKSTLLLTPKEDWQENTRYILTFLAGVKTGNGTMDTKEKIEKRFHTIRPFKVSKNEIPEDSLQNASLSFSHPIESTNLAKYLKISPEVENKKWEAYLQKWTKDPYKNQYFQITAPTEGKQWIPNQDYTLTIDPDMTDIYGRKLEEAFNAEFTTTLPNQLIPLYFPDHDTVFSSDTRPKFVFKYSGTARPIKITLQQVSPEQENEEYTINLAQSREIQSSFEIDLVKNFPQIFPEEKPISGQYEIKVFEEAQKWPQRSVTFFISDFAVSLKSFANERYTISAETFTGEKIENIEKIEIWNNKALVQTIDNPEPNQIINQDGRPLFLVYLSDGKVGIGSPNFNKKMSPYDTRSNYNPWHYKNKLTAVTLTDRPLFRPGDTVYFKSIFRDRENFGKNFPLKNVDPKASQKYTVKIMNPFWEEMFQTQAKTLGSELDGSWIIPTDAPLGAYQVQIEFGENQRTSTAFHVQKFRKPKFLITADFDTEKAIYQDTINAKINAQYAFGGSLTNKKVNYTISLFGQDKNCEWWCGSRDRVLTQGEGILDENGEFNIPINLDIAEDETNPVNWNTLTLNAKVTASHDEISSIEKSIPYFNSQRLINLNYDRYFYPPKTSITQTGTLTDLNKKPIKDKIEVELFLERWVRNDRKGFDGDFYGEWKRADESLWKDTTQSDDKGTFSFDFTTPKKAGNYFLRFMAEDDQSRTISMDKSFWVSGADFESVRKNDQNRILPIFADKKEYKIGEDVEVFFPLADFQINPETSQARIERGEVLETLPINIENRTIKFKTEPWMAPNVYVSVLLNGKDKQSNQDVRWGSVKIPITDPSRKLDIKLQPIQKIYRPGDEIEVKIKTTIGNEPHSASVTLSVVDQTLLALMSRPKLNLWQKFLAEVPLGVSTYHTLANYTSAKQLQEILAEVEKIKSRLALGHGGGGGPGKKGGEFKPRGDFKDTATFIAKIQTDKNGEAIAKFKAPDNLTTWHIWAVGHTENNAFGESESSTQVTLPMLVSEIMPNGFGSGDQAEIGVLIRRDNSENKTTNVKVRLNIPANITANITEKEIEVSEEARVFFPIKIKELTDLKKDFEEVEIGFEIESDDGLKDAIVLKRKVFPPKFALSVADFFRIEDAEKIRIFPDFINSAQSTLSLELSPSIVTKLQTLIDITQRMNYGCAEQRLSKSTAILLQKQLDKTLGKKTPDIDLQALKENRDSIEKAFVDDGFGYWSNAQKPSVWVTTNILENKWLWKEYGARFDGEKLESAKKYLHRKVRSICDTKNWQCLDDTTRNYAASVLAANEILTIDDLDFLTQHAQTFESKVWWIRSARLLKEKGKDIPPTSKKFEASVWTQIQQNLKARDRYIFWEESDRVFYSQNERLSAIILEELIHTGKWKEYHHKIARYLIESKQKHLSGNTAMRMLRTLRFYAEKYEVENFDAQFLAQTIGNQVELTKGSFETLDQVIKYKTSLNDDPHFEKFSGIEIFTKNKKPFYADVKLREILPANQILPTSKGFFLQRGIYALDDEAFKNPITDLEKGKTYVVRLQIVTNTSHRQVALVDHAPAGAEFINLDFQNTDQTLKSYVDNGECYGWCRPNFDHQEFHETSARFFADYISAGTHEVKYLIQARIAGKYESLPAQIEEMYFPEVFATTKGEIIVIK